MNTARAEGSANQPWSLLLTGLSYLRGTPPTRRDAAERVIALGTASAMGGHDPPVHGLGLVSLIALAPIVALIVLGLLVRWKTNAKDSRMVNASPIVSIVRTLPCSVLAVKPDCFVSPVRVDSAG